MNTMVRAVLACGLGAAALLAVPAQVAGQDAQDELAEVRRLRAAGEILPLEQIARHAQAIKAGEILETDLERKPGGYVYEVEVLDAGGHVWELKLDAKTGQLIKLELDD